VTGIGPDISTHLIWHPVIRIVCFWVLLIVTVLILTSSVTFLSLGPIPPFLNEVARGDFSGVAKPEFAYALAALLGATGAGWAIAFGLMHTAAISFSLGSARRDVDHAASMGTFSKVYETLNQKLKSHPLIGSTWELYDATLLKPTSAGAPIRSTVRPQTFLNVGAARTLLPGLKFMGSIPGYYVGLGLLLTFIGLVLALSSAATAVNSADTQGMQTATRGLLHVATFKFATSIAGLGVSIVLSFIFKGYVIIIESAFDRFDHAVELRMPYAAPQAIAAEMNARMEEQVVQLKEINSEQFFSRMGEKISPAVQAAMSAAIAPIGSSINSAVQRMSETSKSGVEELLEKFSASVQGGAGQELTALAETLAQLNQTLTSAQAGIHQKGEDFGRRMSEAAEKLSTLVERAAGRLDEGSEKSRSALNDIIGELRATFKETNDKIQQSVTDAAGTAASHVQAMLGDVFKQVEAQMASFKGAVAEFQNGLGGQLEETRRSTVAAQAAAVQTVSTMAAEAARAIEHGLAGAFQRINGNIHTLVSAMSEATKALAAQANSLQDATEKSRAIAAAFQATAADFRAAAAPLIQSSERIAS
jgi:ABC-type transporter Mla subunit MlaD